MELFALVKWPSPLFREMVGKVAKTNEVIENITGLCLTSSKITICQLQSKQRQEVPIKVNNLLKMSTKEK